MSWVPDHLRLSRERHAAALAAHNATRERHAAAPLDLVHSLPPSLARAFLPIAKTRARAFFADPRAMRALRQRASQ